MAFVFVYGTLRHGQTNHYIMKKADAILACKDYLYGTISFIKIDGEEYPALTIDKQGSIINGEVYLVPNDKLYILDDFEELDRGFYKRALYRLNSGIIAWVYVLNNKE